MKTFATKAPPRSSVSHATASAIRTSSSERASSVILMPMVFGAMSLVTRWKRPGWSARICSSASGASRSTMAVLHPRLPEVPDGLEVDPDRDAALAHHVGEDLEEPARRGAEVEDRVPLPEQPVALQDLVDLEGGAGAQPGLLRLAVVEVLRVVGLRHGLRYPARPDDSQADMTRTKILALCAPVAAAGLAVSVHATFRVNGRSARARRDARGEHRRRANRSSRRCGGSTRSGSGSCSSGGGRSRSSSPSARRDRLLGLLLTAGAGLAGAALSVMSRISAEIEEDRRHVGS